MKKALFTLITLFTMGMNINAKTLTTRQKDLARVACLEAQGDLKRLEPAIVTALNDGVTINELKEAFSQLYAYTGFPRSLNALGILQKVLKKGSDPDVSKSLENKWKEGEPWQRPNEWDDAKTAFELGKKNQTQLSGKPFDYTFCPQDDYYLKAHLFGDIFAGNTLSKEDRELVTVAALSGLKGVAPQLAAHKAGAVNMGNKKEVVDELCRYLSEEGLSQCDCSADANAGAWPLGDPNVNYAKFFIGDSHLAHITPKNFTAQDGKKQKRHCHLTTSHSSQAAATTGIYITVRGRYLSACQVRDFIRNGARKPSVSMPVTL